MGFTQPRVHCRSDSFAASDAANVAGAIVPSHRHLAAGQGASAAMLGSHEAHDRGPCMPCCAGAAAMGIRGWPVARQQVARVAGEGDADDGGGRRYNALHGHRRVQAVHAHGVPVAGRRQQEPPVRRQRQVVDLVPVPGPQQLPLHAVLVLRCEPAQQISAIRHHLHSRVLCCPPPGCNTETTRAGCYWAAAAGLHVQLYQQPCGRWPQAHKPCAHPRQGWQCIGAALLR